MKDDKEKVDWYCGETRSLTNNYGTIVYNDTKMDTMQFRTSHSKEGKVALMCPRCNKMTHVTVSINNIVTQNTPDNINDFDWYAPVTVANEYYGICKYCEEDVHFIEIDEGISLAIEALNEKGYITEYCCAGHTETEEDTQPMAYIKFKHKADVDTIAETIKNLDIHTWWYKNRNTIRSRTVDDKQRQEDLLKIVNALPYKYESEANYKVYVFDNKLAYSFRANTLEEAEAQLKADLECGKGTIGSIFGNESKPISYVLKDGELVNNRKEGNQDDERV